MIEFTPKVSNEILKEQLQAYGWPYTITVALVQQAKTADTSMIFGSPTDTVKSAWLIHEK